MGDLHRERGGTSWFDKLTTNGNGMESAEPPFVLSLSKDEAARPFGRHEREMA